MIDPGIMYQGTASGEKIKLGHGWALVPSGVGTISLAEGAGGTYFVALVVMPGLDLAIAGLAGGAGIEAVRKAKAAGTDSAAK